MDSFDLAKTLLNVKSGETNGSSQTKTIVGVATSDSEEGVVSIDFGGDSASYSGEQSVEIATTQPVKKGDNVIVTLVGADGSAKSPIAMGVIGRGDELQSAVDTACEAAAAAETAASSAQESAENASEYAARALGNLSTVQSVAETLSWIAAHGTMSLTSDVALNPTHVYFVVDPNGDYTVNSVRYSVVTEPDIDDIGTYYELSIDESLNNYVGTHLALTSEGLWLIPSSSGGYKILIATGSGTTYTTAGTYIIDASGKTVSSFTAGGVQIGESEKHNVRLTETQLKFYNEEGDVVGEMGTSEGTAVHPQNGEIIFTGHPSDEGTSYGTFDVVPEHEPILSEAGQTTNGIKVTLNLIYLQSGDARVPVNSVTVYEPDTEYEMLAAIYYPDVFWVNFYIQYVSASDVIRIRTNPSNGEVYSLGNLIDFEFVADYNYYLDYVAPYYTFGTRQANANKGAYSVAAGTDLEASGLSAFAEGNDNAATAAYSHVEGSGTLASGASAHAEGENTTASGEGTHAEGIGTLASGTLGNRAGHAEGINTRATGEGSHAEGYNTEASGPYSHAGGIGTIVSGSGETAIGQYNAVASNALFTVGSGTADTDRLNAFQINRDGYMSRRGPNVACDIYVTDTSSQIGQAPSADKYTTPFLLKDKDGSNTCYIQSVIYANGNLRTDYITTRLDANGNRLMNGFYQVIHADGTFGIAFTNSATRLAWLDGLGAASETVNMGNPTLASGIGATIAANTSCKTGRQVSINLRLTGATRSAGSQPICTLPSGFRPSAEAFCVILVNGVYRNGSVSTAGVVNVYGGVAVSSVEIKIMSTFRTA